MTARKQFDKLTASELHCAKCGGLRPVRERLLLVVPGGEIHSYRCAVCGETLGTREVRAASQLAVPRAAPMQASGKGTR